MITKTCNKCKETKATTEFHKSKSFKDGLQYTCKQCQKVRMATYFKTPVARKSKQRNSQRFRDSLTDLDKAARGSARCARDRSSLSSADLYGGSTYTEACAMTIPFAEERLRLEAETGVAHEIDHIIPIAAGGTHTKENLQVLTAQENNKKGKDE